MRLLNCALSIIVCINLWSCKSAKNKETLAHNEALKKIVNSKNFRIESDWAYPQTTNAMQQVLNTGILGPGNNAGSISLIGNSNFLEISGDSVRSYLPYFGERQMHVGYANRDSAIELQGLMTDYHVSEQRKGGFDIRFEAQGASSERYNVTIRLFTDLSTNLLITSTSRFPISYRGFAQ